MGYKTTPMYLIFQFPKRVLQGIICGSIIGIIKGDTRTSDFISCMAYLRSPPSLPVPGQVHFTCFCSCNNARVCHPQGFALHASKFWCLQVEYT